MHVEVDLAGMTVGGVACTAGPWRPGKIIGVGAGGLTLSVQLDTPIGGGVPHGLFRRPSPGQDMVAVEPERARPIDPATVLPDGIPAEIVALAHAGKTTEAIRRYRALNGATLQEAQTAINRL
jgi:hypothetical protein